MIFYTWAPLGKKKTKKYIGHNIKQNIKKQSSIIVVQTPPHSQNKKTNIFLSRIKKTSRNPTLLQSQFLIMYLFVLIFSLMEAWGQNRNKEQGKELATYDKYA